MPLRWLERVRRDTVVSFAEGRRFGYPPAALERRRLNPDDVKAIGYVRGITTDFWLERPLATNWVAAYRFTAQEGQPVISELRIFPALVATDRTIAPDEMLSSDTARPPGRWRAEVAGALAPAPRGGLRARVVHGLRLGAALRHAHADLAALRRSAPNLFAAAVPAPADNPDAPDIDAGAYARFSPAAARAALTPRGAGRKGHGILFFTQRAKEYVARLEAGDSRPAVTIARRLGLTPAGVRDMIFRARKRGLLTPAFAQGQRGGALTPKAIAILREGAAKRGAPNARKSIATRRAPGNRRQRRTR